MSCAQKIALLMGGTLSKTEIHDFQHAFTVLTCSLAQTTRPESWLCGNSMCAAGYLLGLRGRSKNAPRGFHQVLQKLWGFQQSFALSSMRFPCRGPIAPSGPDCTVRVGARSGPDCAVGPRLSRAPSTVPSWYRLVLLDTVVRPHPKVELLYGWLGLVGARLHRRTTRAPVGARLHRRGPDCTVGPRSGLDCTVGPRSGPDCAVGPRSGPDCTARSGPIAPSGADQGAIGFIKLQGGILSKTSGEVGGFCKDSGRVWCCLGSRLSLLFFFNLVALFAFRQPLLALLVQNGDHRLFLGPGK